MSKRALAWLVAIFTVAAAVVRIPALFGDLWLDEIWSVKLAKGSLADVLLRQKVDNNHLLNTIYLHFCAGIQSPAVLRLLSWVTGTAAVAFIGLAAARFGRAAAVIALMIATLCYPLVHFSTEARGYAPAMCAAMAAFWFMDRWFVRERTPDLVGFRTATVAGLLAHLTFLYAYAGLFAWSFEQTFRKRDVVKRLGDLHIYALGCLTALSVLFVAGMQYGGGNPKSALDSAGDLLAWATGIGTTIPHFLILAGVVAILGYELLDLRRTGDAAWLFFGVCLFGAPPVLILSSRVDFFSERYLLLCLPAAILLIARTLARAFNRGGVPRLAVALLLMSFAAAQIFQLLHFYQFGRGQYRAAIAFMASKTEGDVITVTSDHDFRNGMVLRYHVSGLEHRIRMNYSRWSASNEAPEWLLIHDLAPSPNPPRVRSGYTLQKIFPYYGLSGWNWIVYRRAPALAHPH